MTSSNLRSFFGGPPLQVAIRLAVISLIVGAVLSYVGWHPLDLFDAFKNFFENIWSRGWDAIAQIGQYILLGAMIVIPIWLLVRILGNKS